MSKMKSVVGLAVGVALFGSLLAGCDSDEGKVSKDEKVSVEKKAVGLDKTTEPKNVKSTDLVTTVFDGGKYTISFDGTKSNDTKTFRLTYKNTLKKDITFTYEDNKRVSFVLLDDEGDLVAEKDLNVTGDLESSEVVKKGSTFAYTIDVEDVPNGIYTLELTHFGKSPDVKTELMTLPGITFGDENVSVTTVSKADTSVKKVTDDRPIEDTPVKKSEPTSDTKKEAVVEKKDGGTKTDGTKADGSKVDGSKADVPVVVDKEVDKKPDVKKDVVEKIPALKADVVFNGWADSHSVEVMLGDTPAVFQVSEKAIPAIEDLEAGAKVSFVFTQNGMTRTVLGVMK